MIDKNQLRLGNIVTWQDEEEVVPLIITGIMDGDDAWVEMTFADGTKDGTDCDYSSLKPIPITPAILVACGFEEIGDSKDFWKEEIGMGIGISRDKDNNLSLYNNQDLEVHPHELKHLHQLQNLFYCLTGRELNFKP